MNFTAYLDEFEQILNGEQTQSPYDQGKYIEYVKLNKTRQNRWLKHGILLPELVSVLKSITQKQQWIVISEAWCGDAAHALPFIWMMTQENSKIKLDIHLRDSNSEIDSYLTKGTKSIPILIIRDDAGKDLAVWGPRPKACQDLHHELKAANTPKEEEKIAIQNWYNQDKGASLQEELLRLLTIN